jgi:serine protease Do
MFDSFNYRLPFVRRPRILVPLSLLFASTAAMMSQQSSTRQPTTPPSGAVLAEKAPSSESSPPRALAELNDALEKLADKVSPAVVQILVTGYVPLKEQDRSQTALIVRQHAVGSGVIVDPNGYIMTNAHVVEGAQRIRIALPIPGDTGRDVPIGKRHILEAKLIGVHQETDLALLKIDDTDLPTLPLLTQERPRVGQLVFAIGSPEGLQNSVTMGVVSAVARQPDPKKAMTYIQTDAPINPGNSGGPLVDMNGSVVGINTFILSEGGGSEGLGFAVPARVVDFVYRSLRKYGHVHRVEIGAAAQEITPDMAEGLHLARRWGVVIADVAPNGPAASAGLRIQDIVLRADDRRIETLPQLSAALYLHPVDHLLKLEILRGGEQKTLYVPAIEEHDPMDQLLDATDPEKSLIPKLGILGIDLNSNLRSEFSSLRIPSGVIVLGRAADLITPQTGLQTGDVIHALNTAPITSMEDLRAAVQALKSGTPVVLQVERSDGFTYLSFEME